MGNSVQNCNRTVSWAFTYTLGKSSPPLFFFMDVDRNLAKPVSEVRSGGYYGGVIPNAGDVCPDFPAG